MSTHPKSPPTDADGSSSGFEIGDLVVDTDDTNPNLACVINLPGIPCRRWDAYKTESGEQLTVADTNPDYDPDAHVVVCLFVDQIEEHYPDWDGTHPLDLATVTADDVTHYGFPPGRLDTVVSDETADTSEVPEPPTGLEELADDLRPGATVEMEHEDGEYVLEVEKIGMEYTITETGDVRGAGPHADAFRRKATKFLDSAVHR